MWFGADIYETGYVMRQTFIPCQTLEGPNGDVLHYEYGQITRDHL